jgi:hypothetical protein
MQRIKIHKKGINKKWKQEKIKRKKEEEQNILGLASYQQVQCLSYFF